MFYLFAFMTLYFLGSSAGAGSGEFHVYRHLRRKEFARLHQIDFQARNVSLFFIHFVVLVQLCPKCAYSGTT